MSKYLRIAGVAGVVLALLAAVWFLFPHEQAISRTSEDFIALRKEVVEITTSATTGSGSTDRDIHGHVYAIHLDFGSTVTTTTDTTFSQASPALTLMTVSNSATDAWFYPVVEETDSAGAGTSTYTAVTVADAIDIAMAQTTSGTQVLTATIYWGQ